MAKVHFKVSARAARLIGRENVATSHGAITELVKNGYDADASACVVLFVRRWKSLPTFFTSQEFELLGHLMPEIDSLVHVNTQQIKIRDDLSLTEKEALQAALDQVHDLWIIDNGNGMSADVINDRWMVIGTDAKEVNARSEGGRVVTGAKGIGRFALDRLGRESDLFSGQVSSSPIIHWFVDWADFEGEGKIVSDVEALLETEEQSLADVYEAHDLSSLLPNHGPMREDQVKLLSFEKGTAIRIGLLHDVWQISDTLRLKETLSSLLPPHERADLTYASMITGHPLKVVSSIISRLISSTIA